WMIFPGVRDHGIHMLPGDLQHGGHTRGDTPSHSVHPDYEIALSCGRWLAASYRNRQSRHRQSLHRLRLLQTIAAAANFRPVAVLDPEVAGRVSKSPQWSEIWISGSTMREQLYIKGAR